MREGLIDEGGDVMVSFLMVAETKPRGGNREPSPQATPGTRPQDFKRKTAKGF